MKDEETKIIKMCAEKDNSQKIVKNCFLHTFLGKITSPQIVFFFQFPIFVFVFAFI